MRSSQRTRRNTITIGDHLRTWRKLHGLTAEQVSERARIDRGTLRRLEHGEEGVGLDVFLEVCRVLGVVQDVVRATDPYETDLGRARADQQLPERVRR